MNPPRERTGTGDAANDPCGVPGCGAPAARHLSLAEARKVFHDMPEKGRRGPLCRDHYREWKKATKESRKLDRLAW